MTSPLASRRRQPSARAEPPTIPGPASRNRRRLRAEHEAAAEDGGAEARFVSVKTLAKQWDCSRTTVSRLLERAAVRAFYFGRGRNGSKRYLRSDIEAFLAQLETA
jgi:hypothetical protein